MVRTFCSKELRAYIAGGVYVHVTVTPSLLAPTFLPLLKSSVKDPSDPGSYRAIAGSSIVRQSGAVAVGTFTEY